MALRLEFLTEDQQAINLANRYWAMDEEGEYLERVADLLPFRDITKSGAVAKYLREICRAFDENQICPVCEEGIYVSARVDAKKTLRRAHQICESCQKRQKKDREYLEVTERADSAERQIRTPWTMQLPNHNRPNPGGSNLSLR